ncbi:MAG: PQQ-dependent sugar dehydrogenase [Acidimicrobiales bacterium]
MRRLPIVPLVMATLALGLALAPLPARPALAAVPADFADELVTSVGAPTALAFTPDGRMLIATQAGSLRVFQNGALVATPAITLTGICTNSERGLLGVAIDPAFSTNGFVFLYYSANRAGDCGTGTVNRVSRFVMTGNALSGETVLIDNIPSPAGNHNGGDLNFGKDGLLYVSVGDGGCDYPGGTPSGCAGSNDAARDRNVLVGKILRVDRNGGIPTGNPFTGAGTARCNTGTTTPGLICQETFAWGLRNPFRFAFDPNTAATRFHINDVGQGLWEEIDLGTAGADYGWNVREGHCANGSTTSCGPPPAGMTNPIFDYIHADGCNSITGGAFVPNGVWPAEYDGTYLFADFVCGQIFRLDPNVTGGYTRVALATGLGGGSAVHLRFGPWNATQALYYTSYAGGGQIHRITHTPPPGPPAVALHPLGPSRIVDSRQTAPPVGPYSTPWGPNQTRDVTVAGVGAVPAAAAAVALNVTVTGTTAPGYLTIWPTGASQPSASSLNWAPGQTIANAVTVKVGVAGRISVFNPTGTTHVIVDVVGSYDTSAGDGLTSLSPQRILDSRSPGPGATPYSTPWASGQTRNVPVAGVGGVPAGADAVVLNATVTRTTAAGFLTVWPAGSTLPTASSLNWSPGQTIANAVTAKVGAGGQVSVHNASGSTDIIFDVVGYFTAGRGLLFHPLSPVRIQDSRPGSPVGPFRVPWGPQVTRDVAVAGTGGMPADAGAALLNVTATGSTATSFLTIWPTGQSAPDASSLNWEPGQTIPNSVTAKVGTGGSVTIRNAAGDVHVIADTSGWYG